MKVKLLRKIRQRYKIIYLGNCGSHMFNFYEVIDSKGTSIKKYSDKSLIQISNGFHTVNCPSFAEMLSIEIMGVMFVHKHRLRVDKRKNRSLIKKHFTP